MLGFRKFYAIVRTYEYSRLATAKEDDLSSFVFSLFLIHRLRTRQDGRGDPQAKDRPFRMKKNKFHKSGVPM